jgi:hypothetical protein
VSDPNSPSSSGAQPEYLGSAAAQTDPEQRPPRRWGVVAAVAGGVALAAGVGGWGVAQLLGGGAGPASAVPSIAVAYLSVDLDPSATQKIEALRMLKKFPAIDAELDLGVRDDLRRWVFEQVRDEGLCPGLDYARDVEPWLGDRMAVAAVPGHDAPLAPLLVVQVRDRDAADEGVQALQDCAAPDGDGGAGEPAGVAFVGDYMLVTQDQADADSLAKAAEAAPLEEDAAFTSWMDAVGEPGVVTAYAAPDAPRLMAAMAEEQGQDAGELSRSLGKDFDGMAGVLRFHDGSMEGEFLARGLPPGIAAVERPTSPALGDLPDTTAAALTLSLPEGWLQGYLDALEGVLGADEPGGFWAGLEAETGLKLPEDLETMFGTGVSLSVDASADLGRVTLYDDLDKIPVALRISGDSQEIRRVVDTLSSHLLGRDADVVKVASGEDVVVVGLQPEYVDRLLTPGSLGELDAFRSVVPEADRATGAFFVNFDAGNGWLDALADGDAEAAANLTPLDALGVSTWREDDVQHGLFRLTTD